MTNGSIMAERRDRSSDNRDDRDFQVTDVWTDHTQVTTSNRNRRSPSGERDRSFEGRSRSLSWERGKRRARRERTPNERRHRSQDRTRQALAAIRFGPPAVIGGGIRAPPFLFRDAEKDDRVPAGIRGVLHRGAQALLQQAGRGAKVHQERR